MMGNNLVKQALNNTLSGLSVSQGDARELLVQAKGGKKVKRKLSLVMVLSIILIVIAIGAVAAVLLSGKEFVDQVLAPMASSDKVDKWTPEEIEEIVDLAEKNGIQVTEEIRSRLEKADGSYKVELMRSFAKLQLGSIVSSWRIEDQAWFDELLVRCGLLDKQSRVLPSEGEISESDATRAIETHIKAKLNLSNSITDARIYKRYAEYREFTDDGGKTMPRRWFFTFVPENPALETFQFTLSSRGDIESASVQPGIRNAVDVTTSEAVFDYYFQRYGMHYLWTQKVWEELQKDLKRSIDAHGHTMNLTVSILKQQYGSPNGSKIAKEGAIERAYSAVAEAIGKSARELSEEYAGSALYLIGDKGPIWKVCLINSDPVGRRTFDLRHAEVNALTGEVTNIGHYER